MRTSSYTIYIDLPERNYEVLISHGYAGTYDIVTSDVADFLRSLDPHKPSRPLFGAWKPKPLGSVTEEEIGEPTITHLKRRGYLTEMSVEEERTFLEESIHRVHLERNHHQPIFVLMPTYNCNLRCPYCFQDHMRTKEQNNNLLQTVSFEGIERTIKGIESIERRIGIDPGSYERNVGLFGGEPLLRSNRPLIEHIMTRLKQAGAVRFWAATNATELDAYVDLLGPDGIGTLQITLDGPPDEHDQRRVYADGSGSFARIARNIKAALEQGTFVQVRVNVDRNNVRMLPAIARIAHAEGWVGFERFDLHAAPINAGNDKTDRETLFNTRELADILDELKANSPEMSAFRDQDNAIKIKVRQLMSGASQPDAVLKAGFCGAHDRMYVLDSFGDVYACWERTGAPEIRIGQLSEEGEFVPEEQTTAHWRNRSAVSNPVCAQCRYVLYCGGGCAIMAENHHGRFYGNFCDEYANRFRRRAAEAYLDHIAGRMTGAAEAPCGQ